MVVHPRPVERLRGRAGQAQRKRRLARTKGLCERCKAKGIVRIATVVDHTIPLALGGTDDDENTRNLCDPCHEEVTAEQFGHKQVQPIGEDGWPADTGDSNGSPRRLSAHRHRRS